ncbi:MAG: acetyltransferase, partial [Acidimicrobiaceae bacterium]|nr:acetyltransferase [Acidimicrobiaceae bacterium]
PVWASATRVHSRLAEVRGRAARYHPRVSPFAALAPDATEEDFADLAALAGPASEVLVPFLEIEPPAGWSILSTGVGLQMVGEELEVAEDPETEPLSSEHVPEMLDLIVRTEPGPFLPRTVELGTYLGIRRNGALIAMAGERMRPPGYTELSAVCTDPAYQGQGLATRLVRALGSAVRVRGEVPMLHVSATNGGAIRLYEALGFRARREVQFQLLQTPSSGPAGR